MAEPIQVPHILAFDGLTREALLALERAVNIALTQTGNGGGGGVTDHGALSGLGDDDHPQYLNEARGDGRYVQDAGDVMTGPLGFIATGGATGAIGLVPDPGDPGGGDVLQVQSSDGVSVTGPYIRLDSQDPMLTLAGAVDGSPLIAAGFSGDGSVRLGWGAPVRNAYEVIDSTDTGVVIKAAGGLAPSPWVPLGLTLTVTEDIPVNEATWAMVIPLSNSTTRTGTIEFGYSANGGPVTSRDVTVTLAAQSAPRFGTAFPNRNAIPPGTTVELYARVLDQSNTQFAVSMVATPADPAVLRLTWVGDTAPPVVTDHGALTGLEDDDHPQYLTPDEVNPVTPLYKATYPDGSIDVGLDPAFLDHGALGGLGDDDHPQYLRPEEVTAGTGITVTRPADGTVVIASTVSGGVTDHGLLTGLADDDHPQYHNDARGDARYVNITGDTMTGPLITPRPLRVDAASGLPAQVDLRQADGYQGSLSMANNEIGLTARGAGLTDASLVVPAGTGRVRATNGFQFKWQAACRAEGITPVTSWTQFPLTRLSGNMTVDGNGIYVPETGLYTLAGYFASDRAVQGCNASLKLGASTLLIVYWPPDECSNNRFGLGVACVYLTAGSYVAMWANTPTPTWFGSFYGDSAYLNLVSLF